jgi:hypothetical protein
MIHGIIDMIEERATKRNLENRIAQAGANIIQASGTRGRPPGRRARRYEREPGRGLEGKHQPLYVRKQRTWNKVVMRYFFRPLLAGFLKRAPPWKNRLVKTVGGKMFDWNVRLKKTFAISELKCRFYIFGPSAGLVMQPATMAAGPKPGKMQRG